VNLRKDHYRSWTHPACLSSRDEPLLGRDLCVFSWALSALALGCHSHCRACLLSKGVCLADWPMTWVREQTLNEGLPPKVFSPKFHWCFVLLSQFEMSKSVCLCFSQSEPPFAWQTCIENTTLYSGSLGSGVDEERS
jgi:hypothetical protein